MKTTCRHCRRDGLKLTKDNKLCKQCDEKLQMVNDISVCSREGY